jgi:hypothetical protein
MNRGHVHHFSYAGQRETLPTVETTPITSSEERRFLAGDITPNEYLDMGQRRAENWIQSEDESDYIGSTRRLLHVFMALASMLYLLLSFGFLIADSRNAALASAIVSLSFMAAITLYKALRRGI